MRHLLPQGHYHLLASPPLRNLRPRRLCRKMHRRVYQRHLLPNHLLRSLLRHHLPRQPHPPCHQPSPACHHSRPCRNKWGNRKRLTPYHKRLRRRLVISHSQPLQMPDNQGLPIGQRPLMPQLSQQAPNAQALLILPGMAGASRLRHQVAGHLAVVRPGHARKCNAIAPCNLRAALAPITAL